MRRRLPRAATHPLAQPLRTNQSRFVGVLLMAIVAEPFLTRRHRAQHPCECPVPQINDPYQGWVHLHNRLPCPHQSTSRPTHQEQP